MISFIHLLKMENNGKEKLRRLNPVSLSSNRSSIQFLQIVWPYRFFLLHEQGGSFRQHRILISFFSSRHSKGYSPIPTLHQQVFSTCSRDIKTQSRQHEFQCRHVSGLIQVNVLILCLHISTRVETYPFTYFISRVYQIPN